MYEFLVYHVRDVMTENPLTVKPEISLQEMEAIFQEHDFNGIPVVDKEGTLLGLVTKLDLLKAFVFEKEEIIPSYEQIVARRASDVMTKEPEVVDPQTPLTRVLQRMIETRNKSFPIIENGTLIGIIAREDVLKALHLAASGKTPTPATV
jgi:CBS domain-containing protein